MGLGYQMGIVNKQSSGPILLVSNDRTLYEWARPRFDQEVRIVAEPEDEPRIECVPAAVIVGCDYSCVAKECIRKFRIGAFWPGIPVFVARAVLGRLSLKSLNMRLCVPLQDQGSPRSILAGYEISEEIQSAVIKLKPHVRDSLILEHKVVVAHGEIGRIRQIRDLVRMPHTVCSRRFRRAAGIPLKRFLDRIRLCHSLWSLISTSGSIKEIAIEFGFKQGAFSRRFYQAFSLWPSQVRTLGAGPIWH